MKHLLVAILAASFVGSASAQVKEGQPVAFDFQGVPLIAVMQATYKSLLQRDFVITPEVLALDKRVSMSVKAVPLDKVPAFVDGLLAAQGVQAERREDGIYYLVVKDRSAARAAPGVPGASLPEGRPGEAPAAPVVEVSRDLVKLFHPQNRSVEFMVTVLNAAFSAPVARPGGSAVIVAAPKDRIETILELADDLDVLPKNVEVSASFVEVATSASGSSGLSLVASVLGARFGVQVGQGQGAVTVSNQNFQLILDALSADGRFKQVSNPRLVGDDGEKLVLSVGDETPTLQSSGKDNAGNTVQSIVYRPSGVILDVLPKVLGSGRLSLQVDGQVSSFKATVTGVTGSPTLSKRQVKTAVTVGDGDVLIIGGLEDSTVATERSGLSFLPRSWSATSKSDKRTDLVLVLSAKVLAKK